MLYKCIVFAGQRLYPSKHTGHLHWVNLFAGIVMGMQTVGLPLCMVGLRETESIEGVYHVSAAAAAVRSVVSIL